MISIFTQNIITKEGKIPRKGIRYLGKNMKESIKQKRAERLYFFSNALAKYRKEAGMTQDDLSKRTGIPRATISGYENGIRMANENALSILSEALHIKPCQLKYSDYQIQKNITAAHQRKLHNKPLDSLQNEIYYCFSNNEIEQILSKDIDTETVRTAIKICIQHLDYQSLMALFSVASLLIKDTSDNEDLLKYLNEHLEINWSTNSSYQKKSTEEETNEYNGYIDDDDDITTDNLSIYQKELLKKPDVTQDELTAAGISDEDRDNYYDELENLIEMNDQYDNWKEYYGM